MEPMTKRTVTTLLLISVLLVLTPGVKGDDQPPLALLVEVQALGKGPVGTVMGVVVGVAPEDRERVGDRVRVITSLADGTEILDRQTAVSAVESDGSVFLYREWQPGTYELRVGVASIDAKHSGMWISDIEVPESTVPFEAPEGATPDAVALELTPPRSGGVRFHPPPEIGGIGAVQLEVEAPADTGSVEFFQDGQSLGRRNRAPWTVSIPLGQIVRRSTVRAVARDAKGVFLGEDALVLNNPGGQLGVEILLAPPDSSSGDKRTVTVAVSGDTLSQVTLHLDDRPLFRWAECPCVAEISQADLDGAAILAAEAVDSKGVRGDAVLPLTGEGGFVGSVRVELVELPVTVLDTAGTPVTDIARDSFGVFEDDQPVEVEGFGTTADLPLSLALAVDTSGSMEEVFPKVRRAVSGFAGALLRPGDQTALLTFAWEAKVVVPWTDEPTAIGSRLERVVPEGGTSLHDAVVRSLERFRGLRGRQALVLLTDGEDTTSRTGWETAERFAHTMRVPIFPIGLGVGLLDFSGRKTLKDLAAETGGEAFFPKEVEELPAVYARISELLRSQYLMWYTSHSDKDLEQFRTIRVEVDDPDLTVKTIRGYYPGK
jgi:VWFA-related protein